MRWIRPASLRVPDRGKISLIDGCVEGWIPGVTRPYDWQPDGAAIPAGLQLPEGGAMGLRISAEDLQRWSTQEMSPRFQKKESQLRDVEKGTVIDLREIVAVEVARMWKDPRPAWGLDQVPESFREAVALSIDECEDYAARAISELILLFDSLEDAEIVARPPTVVVEGGYHLWARCLSVAADLAMWPWLALENCWLPGHFLRAHGGCVHRWGHRWLNERVYRRRPHRSADEILNLRRVHWDRSLDRQHPLRDCLKVKRDVEIAELGSWLARFGSYKGPVHYILGQVPWDASIVMDNEYHVTGEEILRAAGCAYVEADIPVLYRPHPLETPSLIGTPTAEAACEAMIPGLWVQKHTTLSPMETAQVLEDLGVDRERIQVVTGNSQAGLELAYRYDVDCDLPAFYGNSGLVNLNNPLSWEERAQRWMAYVEWLLKAHYCPVDRVAEYFESYAGGVS